MSVGLKECDATQAGPRNFDSKSSGCHVEGCVERDGRLYLRQLGSSLPLLANFGTTGAVYSISVWGSVIRKQSNWERLSDD